MFVFVFTNVKGILNKVFLLLEQNQEVLVSLSVSMGGFHLFKKKTRPKRKSATPSSLVNGFHILMEKMEKKEKKSSVTEDSLNHF